MSDGYLKAIWQQFSKTYMCESQTSCTWMDWFDFHIYIRLFIVDDFLCSFSNNPSQHNAFSFVNCRCYVVLREETNLISNVHIYMDSATNRFYTDWLLDPVSKILWLLFVYSLSILNNCVLNVFLKITILLNAYL